MPKSPRSPTGFTSIKTISRSQEVKAQLLEAIRRGDYPAGAVLPSERELSDVFGVSRVSVREAIRSLEAIGVIDVFQGRGSFVASDLRDRYLGPFADWLHVHRMEVLELMDVRGALDELAVVQVARIADDLSVEMIARASDAFERAAREPEPDVEALTAFDIAFHTSIARASGSVLLAQLVDELNQLFTEARKVVYAIDRRPVSSALEHTEILAAIRARDPEAARHAAARHVAATRKLLAETAAGTTDTA
jgi:DNA-binding FadR family transcriptional regulator